MGSVFLAGPLWVPLIQDPELPALPARLLASGRLWLAGALYLAAAAVGWLGALRRPTLGLLGLQLVLLPFVPGVLLPLWGMGDQLRGQPVRAMAAAVTRHAQPDEAVAMVGILKPSLHYYSRRVVIYEGNRPLGLVNLADRLVREVRPGQPSTPGGAAAHAAGGDRSDNGLASLLAADWSPGSWSAPACTGSGGSIEAGWPGVPIACGPPVTRPTGKSRYRSATDRSRQGEEFQTLTGRWISWP